MENKNTVQKVIEEIKDFPQQTTFNEDDMSVVYNDESGNDNGKG